MPRKLRGVLCDYPAVLAPHVAARHTAISGPPWQIQISSAKDKDLLSVRATLPSHGGHPFFFFTLITNKGIIA